MLHAPSPRPPRRVLIGKAQAESRHLNLPGGQGPLSCEVEGPEGVTELADLRRKERGEGGHCAGGAGGASPFSWVKDQASA